MKYYSSGYTRTNNHFVIKNLPDQRHVENADSSLKIIISIIQNLISRGNPTVASPFLREKLNLNWSYLKNQDEVRIMGANMNDWSQRIKGDSENQLYPALTFFEDLQEIFKQKKFLAKLFIAECPINQIIKNDHFDKQEVDFYSPLFKLVIEVDGHSHKDSEQKKLDRVRDNFFKKHGIDVFRVSTAQIKSKDYAQLLNTLRKKYRDYEHEIKLYEEFLKDSSSYALHTQLTEIYRYQQAVIELINRNHLDFECPIWQFSVLNPDQIQSLKLALSDLNTWLNVIGGLFNREIEIPNIQIETDPREDFICIDNVVGEYWDDSITDENCIYIREDYFGEKNYRFIKSTEIVKYNIDLNTHQPILEYILNTLYGFSSFNEGQLEIISNTLNGNDTVGLLPTGGGKSLTYQICTFLQPSISFVVAPIKSLMVDQVLNLKEKYFVDCIEYINSDLGSQDQSDILNAYTEGQYLFLVISPERFQQEEFRNRLQMIQAKKQIAYAVIDEAHCLSEWGHDFRTSYLALSKTIKRFCPTSTFLALTATASSKVLQDIRNELNIDSKNVKTITNFTRKELKFHVIETNRFERPNTLAELIKPAEDDIKSFPTLIFTLNVNGPHGCYKLSNQLANQVGVKTAFYSGKKPKDFGIDYSVYKEQTQSAFMKNEIDVLVATKAFGMGIDKPDIRKVIHYGIPSSLESYYQEAGRAGRDRTESDCYVLFTRDQLTDDQKNILFGLDTNVDHIEKTIGEIKGDLNSIFYLMKQGLMNVEVESKIIEGFYNQYLSGRKIQEVTLNEKNEKIIYKLSLLGLVEDWTINWKTKKIIVEMNDYDEDQIKELLFKHIHKYDSTFSQANLFQQPELKPYKDVYESDIYSPLYKLIFILLRWYNDNVIYTRKQSLKNMFNYISEFTDSDDFQSKLETYFKRNDDVYLLEKTVAIPQNINNWWKIYYVETNDKTVPKSKAELKNVSIITSRFLESYKNDPALNLIEGIRALISDEKIIQESSDRLIQSIQYISKLEENLRREILLSILDVANDFLTSDSKAILSQFLIGNGFPSKNDKKLIYQSFKDKFSYGEMVKDTYMKMKELRIREVYPWES
ncbi:RecQ family ATP-dependent DNA helicase [Jeotgalibacillus sp. R-1-5s-1]|uniref:RecQ family ATP-dependent DNA helicase n=1 Tax=Jeotgalibacillus sp. R-1-5s-1 TaxID=2555897 RepID=UPI00106A2044|nr:RecQ family ATP-dependent DNA helicase [Jeotgalibacillus sp. R-1-5s-1]TFD94323.1 RecQ family ATP-dependent DNA helicase [Jeotgalibacillus sp. R-1-5s-1]